MGPICQLGREPAGENEQRAGALVDEFRNVVLLPIYGSQVDDLLWLADNSPRSGVAKFQNHDRPAAYFASGY
ncbi:hypothetical protein SUNI508_10822 [Seiridium unicorne]|uniref:Uncharacterized protein n=1 Tax=Seiridium unicorne TaxID=138068 RepID=A0ABR2UK45_9PEZI